MGSKSSISDGHDDQAASSSATPAAKDVKPASTLGSLLPNTVKAEVRIDNDEEDGVMLRRSSSCYCIDDEMATSYQSMTTQVLAGIEDAQDLAIRCSPQTGPELVDLIHVSEKGKEGIIYSFEIYRNVIPSSVYLYTPSYKGWNLHAYRPSQSWG